ncbi:hypothetical protein BJV74DRAFT_843672, partial [Russula compacta]
MEKRWSLCPSRVPAWPCLVPPALTLCTAASLPSLTNTSYLQRAAAGVLLCCRNRGRSALRVVCRILSSRLDALSVQFLDTPSMTSKGRWRNM